MSTSDAVRFVFMTDCQFGTYASFSGMSTNEIATYAAKDMTVQGARPVAGFAWETRRYERAIAAVNALAPSFAVMGGDMTHDPRSDAEYAEVMRITGLLEPGIPLHWVPGNHDIAFDSVVPTWESIAAYRARFGPDSYVFTHGDVAFIVANSVIWDHPEQVPGAWEEQLGFLTASLGAARDRGHARAIVFAHHPLFTDAPDEEGSYWNIGRERREILLDLFRAHGVEAVFSGHWHRNGGGIAGELEVVVSGPVGYPLGADPPGIRLVEIDADGLRHRYLAIDGLDDQDEE